jgi:PAS domain S-box-containing protein
METELMKCAQPGRSSLPPQLYHSILENLSDPVLIFDAASGELVQRNPAADRLLGQSDASQTADAARRLLTEMRKDFSRLPEDGEHSLKIVHWLVRGQIKHLGCRLQILAADGAQFIVCVLSDDTELQQRRDQDEAYLALAGNLPDIFFRFDTGFRHTYISASITQATGKPPEYFIGKTLEGIGASKEFRSLWEKHMHDVAATGSSVYFEYDFASPDGLLYYQAHLTPEFAFDGSVAGIVGICRDLTSLRAAREELDRQHRMYRSLAENLPDIVFRFDRHHRQLYVNPAITALSGRPPEYYIGRTPRGQGMPAALCDLWESYEDKVLATAAPVSYEYTFPVREGPRYYQAHLAPEFSVDGSVASIVGIARDITGLKQLQEKLRKSQHHYKTLIDNFPDVIIRADRELRHLYVSPSITRMTGQPPEYYLGKTLFDISQKLADDIAPAMQAVFRTGTPVDLDSTEDVPQGMRYLSVRALPEFSGDGVVESVLVIVRDVTAVRTLTDALEDEKKKLEAIFENAPAGIILAGRDGKVMLFNAAAKNMLGRQATNLNGYQKHAQPFYCHPDGKPFTMEELPLPRSLRGESCTDVYMDTITPDGRKLHLLANSVPIRNEEGEITWALAVFRDVTAVRQAEDVLRRDRAMLEAVVDERTRALLQTQLQLAQSLRLADIGALAATVAHEMRTPLAAIATALYNIKRKTANGPELGKHYATIEKKIAESNNIIGNLLSYSHLQQPVFASVNLRVLLKESLAAVADKYPVWQMNVTEDYPQDGGVIDADATQLGMVFTNLIDNAYQSFPGKKGSIALRCRVSADGALVSVRDNGCGIAPEDIDRVFEPFFTRRARGTGIGLALCRGIVQLHKGGIEAQSEKDKGSTFNVTLPLRQQ